MSRFRFILLLSLSILGVRANADTSDAVETLGDRLARLQGSVEKLEKAPPSVVGDHKTMEIWVDSLSVARRALGKAEAETARLEVERKSLLQTASLVDPQLVSHFPVLARLVQTLKALGDNPPDMQTRASAAMAWLYRVDEVKSEILSATRKHDKAERALRDLGALSDKMGENWDGLSMVRRLRSQLNDLLEKTPDSANSELVAAWDRRLDDSLNQIHLFLVDKEPTGALRAQTGLRSRGREFSFSHDEMSTFR